MRRHIPAGALLAALVGLPEQAWATFHLMRIVEVFGGAPAAPEAQYVVLQMFSSGQNFVAGHSIQVFDAAGTEVGSATFAAHVASGTNQARILIATSEAEALFGITADLVMAATISPGGGKVCFNAIDCLAFGNYAGDTTGVGTPFNAGGFPPGIPPGRAMKRRLDLSGGATTLEATDDTNDSASDFGAGLPAPRNNMGASGTTPASTCGNGVIEGLEPCDDGNSNDLDGCTSACQIAPAGDAGPGDAAPADAGMADAALAGADAGAEPDAMPPDSGEVLDSGTSGPAPALDDDAGDCQIGRSGRSPSGFMFVLASLIISSRWRVVRLLHSSRSLVSIAAWSQQRRRSGPGKS